jgi:hypothetical protein
MVVRCYIDESRGPNRTFALGAAVALGTEWTWINSQWKKCLERKNKQLKNEGRKCISRYHASDCESRLGEFLGWNVPEKNEFVKELISIVRAHHIHLVGFSVDLNELAEIYPQIHVDYLEKAAYGILAWLMFSEVVKDARHLNRLPTIKVVYERGDVSQHMMLVYDRMKVSRSYGDLFDSIEKDSWKVLPLQVADLIAFEAMKDRDNETGKTKRARRLSLSALMSSGCGGSRGLHLNKRGLQILARQSDVVTEVANAKE